MKNDVTISLRPIGRPIGDKNVFIMQEILECNLRQLSSILSNLCP